MNSHSSPHLCSCNCGARHGRFLPPSDSLTAGLQATLGDGVTRRRFLHSVGALAAGGVALSAFGAEAAEAPVGPLRPARLRTTLKVQPVLLYEVPQRREATSWRSWGGIQTEADAAKEKERISAELAKLKAQAEFPVEFLPLVTAKNGDAALGRHGRRRLRHAAALCRGRLGSWRSWCARIATT